MTQKANLPLYICILPTFKKRKLEYFFKNQSVYHVAFMKKSSFNINHTMQIHPSVLRLLSWYDTWYKVHTYLQNIKCQNVMAALRRRIVRVEPTSALPNLPYPTFLALLCQNLHTYTYPTFSHFKGSVFCTCSKNIKRLLGFTIYIINYIGNNLIFLNRFLKNLN